MKLNASVSIRSKYIGSCIDIQMIGERKPVAFAAHIHFPRRFRGRKIDVLPNSEHLIAFCPVFEVNLRLENMNEEYILTLPSFSVRSLLTRPSLELNNTACITCPQTGFKANFDFKPKVAAV